MIIIKLKPKDDRVKVIDTYINGLKSSKNKLVDFDEGLFYALVDKVKVNKKKCGKMGLKHKWSRFYLEMVYSILFLSTKYLPMFILLSKTRY